MANDSNKVLVGSGKVGGYIFSLDADADLPTDASATLDSSAKGLGYVSSDGITRTVEVGTEQVEDLNLDIVRTLTTDTSVELSCTLLEVNVNNMTELYGADNVTVTPADDTHGEQIAVRFTGEQLPRRAYVVELVDGENIGRFVIPEGQVTTPGGGELTFVKNQTINHTLTIRAYRATTGEYFNHYTDNGQTSGE